MTKTGNPATSNPDGSWTISYTVAVGNTSGKTLFYTLTDTPPANPAGTTITNWAVTGPGASPTWPTPPTIASASIPTGTTHTFTITANVVLAPSAAPVPNACGEGTGTGIAIVNFATVSNGVDTSTDDGCTSVNPLPVTISKTLTSVAQNVDGSWTIAYAVNVVGPATGTSTYTLTDTPVFAAAQGVTFTGLSWTGQTTGSATVLPAILQGAPGAAISAGQTHTYNLTATATVSVPPGQTLSACVPGQSGPFYNTALVTYPGGSAPANACGAPDKPVVVKTALPATQNTTTGAWTISYTVQVSNPTQIPLAYTLTDTAAALPAGVDGGAWAASDPVPRGRRHVRPQ